MKVKDRTIYAYEVEVKDNRDRLSEPIFTFNTGIRLEDIEPGLSLRMRVRAYYASFHPHSNILKLSQPSPWTEWSDWIESFDWSDHIFHEAKELPAESDENLEWRDRRED